MVVRLFFVSFVDWQIIIAGYVGFFQWKFIEILMKCYRKVEDFLLLIKRPAEFALLILSFKAGNWYNSIEVGDFNWSELLLHLSIEEN